MAEPTNDPSEDVLWEGPASSLGDTEAALEEAIESRMTFLTEWLQEHTPASREELACLDPELREQLFWRYGYLVALRSVRDFMTRRRRVLH